MQVSDVTSIQETTGLIALGLGLVLSSWLLRKKFSKRQPRIAAREAFPCEEPASREPSAGGLETRS